MSGNSYNQSALNTMKQFLDDHDFFKKKALRSFPSISSPGMDGQPHGGAHDPDMPFVNHAELVFQYTMREKVCSNVKEISKTDEPYGDLLMFRYIDKLHRDATIIKLNRRYGDDPDIGSDWPADMANSTFTERLNRALSLALDICPDQSVHDGTYSQKMAQIRHKLA